MLVELGNIVQTGAVDRIFNLGGQCPYLLHLKKKKGYRGCRGYTGYMGIYWGFYAVPWGLYGAYMLPGKEVMNPLLQSLCRRW